METSTKLVIFIVVLVIVIGIGIGIYIYVYPQGGSESPGDGNNPNCDSCSVNCVKCQTGCDECKHTCSDCECKPECEEDDKKCVKFDCAKCHVQPTNRLLSDIPQLSQLQEGEILEAPGSGDTSKYRIEIDKTTGRLNLYGKNGGVVWSTPAGGKGPYYLHMEPDGDLCMIDSDAQKNTWCSGSAGKGNGPYTAVMQYDGNFCVYGSANNNTWCSDTKGK